MYDKYLLRGKYYHMEEESQDKIFFNFFKNNIQILYDINIITQKLNYEIKKHNICTFYSRYL